jgi:hypothetical protein
MDAVCCHPPLISRLPTCPECSTSRAGWCRSTLAPVGPPTPVGLLISHQDSVKSTVLAPSRYRAGCWIVSEVYNPCTTPAGYTAAEGGGGDGGYDALVKRGHPVERRRGSASPGSGGGSAKRSVNFVSTRDPRGPTDARPYVIVCNEGGRTSSNGTRSSAACLMTVLVQTCPTRSDVVAAGCECGAAVRTSDDPRDRLCPCSVRDLTVGGPSWSTWWVPLSLSCRPSYG